MRLYEITEAYLSLESLEETEDIKEVLDSISDEQDVKIENIVYVVKNLEAEIKAYREEEKRLAEKRKSKERKAKFLLDYIFSNMKAIGKDKVKAGTYDLRIQKNPKSVRIYDEEQLFDEYFKYKKEVDKKKIKEAIENGIEVAGAEIVQGEGLRIR